MKPSSLLLVIAIAAVTSFGVVKLAAPPQQRAAVQETKKESAFERVIRTGTLRCAYRVMSPHLLRDPNTGAMSGLSFDLINEATKRLNLKVEWTEEVNFTNFTEGFKTGRYDALCMAGYRWTPAARTLDYSVPLFYTTTNAYVREDDHRFDADLKAINDPSVMVVITDGAEASSFIRQEEFPKSTAYSLPGNTEQSLLLETVATRKGDVALFNAMEAMPYLVANPGKLRRVEGHAPIRAYAHTFSFNKGEHDLVSMFDVVLSDMLTDGTINKILDKYEQIPDSFARIKSAVSPSS